jgi:hypothetical protein
VYENQPLRFPSFRAMSFSILQSLVQNARSLINTSHFLKKNNNNNNNTI